VAALDREPAAQLARGETERQAVEDRHQQDQQKGETGSGGGDDLLDAGGPGGGEAVDDAEQRQEAQTAPGADGRAAGGSRGVLRYENLGKKTAPVFRPCSVSLKPRKCWPGPAFSIR